MTFVVTQACIGVKDLTCIDVCPVDCIHEDGEADPKVYIDPHVCIDCGACVEVCPVKAIYGDYQKLGDLAVYLEIDALWYKDKEAARARLQEVHPA
jgi:NAD-dependent dihydropyrimidine dehydrogenase PreA subunit